MKIDSGTKWPFIIAGGILGVIGLCAWTIIETSHDPVEESHLYMTYYQKADAEANLIINNKIAFNKKWISKKELLCLIEKYGNKAYSKYLKKLL